MIAISHAARTSTAFGAFAAFVTIEIRRALRNRRYVMFSVAFPTGFYLLYTGVLASGASADSAIDGTTWGAYFMVSMATYAAMVAALSGAIVIARERSSGWTRQLRVTPLPAAGYVAGKLVVAYVVTLPAIAAVVIAGIAVDHVSLSAVALVQMFLSIAIGVLPFAALGLLIGYLFDADSAQGAMMVSLFGLAILGGLWAPISSFPDTLATIGRMLPSFRLADLGRDAIAGRGPDLADILVLAAYATAIGALAAWRYRASEQRASG
ncbi:MAG TPA: ABC transporter permease [Candidatus Limnocylindrales bacterium]|jgi:ABC-2 type transport system permease protein|nr:ABC transporter permease [Candidatus Limnocylindrales bacterium]